MFGPLLERLRRSPPGSGPSGDGAQEPAAAADAPGPLIAPAPARPPGPSIDLRPSRAVEDPAEAEMPFLDHLEELRWRIIKCLAGVAATTGLCLFFAGWVVDVLLLGPTRADFVSYRILGLDAVDLALQNRTITG